MMEVLKNVEKDNQATKLNEGNPKAQRETFHS